MKQKRTADAIAQDMNLLISLGWKRDPTPEHETDLFFGKGNKTAIVYLESTPEFTDKPILKRWMFDEKGYAIPQPFTNPLPF